MAEKFDRERRETLPPSRRSVTRRKIFQTTRRLAFVTIVFLAVFVSEFANAQRGGSRWSSAGRGILSGTRSVGGGYGGLSYVNPYGYGWGYPYYGYGYNYGYGYGTQTAYGNAAAARSELVRAQGQAAKSQAQAAEFNEKARAQYLKNKEQYLKMRQQQKAAIESRKEKERAERAERVRRRPSKGPTDLYERLSIDQVDSTTGVIKWPKSLLGSSFEEDRHELEKLLNTIATYGPDVRTASIIKNTADAMKKKTTPIMTEIGFEAYQEARKFLCSLSVEGYYALEEL